MGSYFKLSFQGWRMTESPTKFQPFSLILCHPIRFAFFAMALIVVLFCICVVLVVKIYPHYAITIKQNLYQIQ